MSKQYNQELYRAFKGIWIPKEIWLNDVLSTLEKVFLSEIDSLDNNNGCFASNTYFSNFFKITPQRCSQVVNALIKKKFIKVKYEYKGKQIIKRVLNVLDTYKENFKGGIKSIPIGYKENVKDITKNITKHDNKKENLVFPITLNDDLFKAKWKEWYKHRKELKKTLTFSTMEKQINMLSKYDVATACEMLENSMMNGWQGIFELKNKPKDSQDIGFQHASIEEGQAEYEKAVKEGLNT